MRDGMIEERGVARLAPARLHGCPPVVGGLSMLGKDGAAPVGASKTNEATEGWRDKRLRAVAFQKSAKIARKSRKIPDGRAKIRRETRALRALHRASLLRAALGDLRGSARRRRWGI